MGADRAKPPIAASAAFLCVLAGCAAERPERAAEQAPAEDAAAGAGGSRARGGSGGATGAGGAAGTVCATLGLATVTAAQPPTPKPATAQAPAAKPAAAPPAVPAPSKTETYRPDAEGFIKEWLVLAPLFYDPYFPAGELEIDRAQIPGDASLRPREGATVQVAGQTRAWKRFRSPEALVDIKAALAPEQSDFQTAYAVTYVVAQTPVKGARLRVGTDDMSKVFWNGKPVIRSGKMVHAGPAKRDALGALVDLRAGVNVLIAKVVNDEQRWGLFARLVGEGGKPLAGIQIATSPDGKGETAAPDAEGFIRDWLVLGPIPYKPRPYALGQLAKQQIPNEAKLAPRAGEEVWANGQPHRWAPWAAGANGVLDFNAYILQHKRLVPPGRWEPNSTVFNPLGYAATYVYAPEEMKDLRVRLGVNDHGLVYVNGKRAAIWDEPGALVKDKVEGKVTLKKGVNVLVMKIVNAGDDWQGAVRFVDRGGKPVTNLDVRIAPPPSESEIALTN